jgi:hypothetical protein
MAAVHQDTSVRINEWLILVPAHLVPATFRTLAQRDHSVIVHSYELEDGTFGHVVYDARSGGYERGAVIRNLYPLRGDCSCSIFALADTCDHLHLFNAVENLIGEARWQEAQVRRGSDNEEME